MEHPDKHQETKAEITQIFKENKGCYGYRRITAELHNRGYKINHKLVQKLMKQCGLKCEVRKKKYRSYKGEIGKIAPNVLARDFKSTEPKKKLVTDVTEFAVGSEKVYLSPILDLYNGEILAYDLSIRPTFSQTSRMLDAVFSVLTDYSEVILHSDQGWQYQMKQYQQRLKEKGIVQSMSRKGNCLDNAVIENFFGILKSEMYYKHKFSSVSELMKAIDEYIYYYNNNRIKLKLKGLSPVQYRTQSQMIA
jgi:transposase InsO family protein